MGLTTGFARLAVQGAHVLVIEVPGWAETRMAVECELARRGWALATSPADADVLLVCGLPGSGLREVAERIWAQLPGPRARVSIERADDAVIILDRAKADLLDETKQRADARTRPREFSPTTEVDTGHEQHGDDSPADASHDMGDMDMDMGGMGHGMDMPMPGGIPLASGGEDRDGLEMDVLNIPLGPVLPHWPAGLVVRCVLQGDVIVSAEAEILAAAEVPIEGSDKEDEGRRTAIRRCDDAARLLAISGWSSAAVRARTIRDTLDAGTPMTDSAAQLDVLSRRVRRSRVLRWSLKSVPSLDPEPPDPSNPHTVSATTGPATASGRLIAWLDEAARLARGDAVAGLPALHDDAALQRTLFEAIPELVRGTDIATARLAVASLGIDTAVLAEAESHAHD